jgi:hypothetical protein
MDIEHKFALFPPCNSTERYLYHILDELRRIRAILEKRAERGVRE